MNDLITIITPLYNSENYIEDCITSVINQTYQNWEMLIVDDSSTDRSRSILQKKSLSDKRIKHILLDTNVGAAQARNLAIDKSTGSYIAFLDSDDTWMPEKLDIQLQYMKDNNYDFTFTSYNVISENGLSVISKIIVPRKITYNEYLKNTIIGCLTVMINKSKYDLIRMPLLRSSHDMALWLDLLRHGKDAYGINICLSNYRLVKTSNTSNKLRAIYDVWQVYRDYEGLSFFYSLYNWFFYIFNAINKRL